METRKNNNPLWEEEKKELELLDNPAEQRMGNTTAGMWGAFQNINNLLYNKAKRKERVVELRVKMRAYDLDLDIDKDWREYDKIKVEEAKRFDERFKGMN